MLTPGLFKTMFLPTGPGLYQSPEAFYIVLAFFVLFLLNSLTGWKTHDCPATQSSRQIKLLLLNLAGYKTQYWPARNSNKIFIGLLE